MSTQLIQIPSQSRTELMNLSNKSLALVQYDNKPELIKEIAKLLQRLSVLYQVNNWSIESSVILSEWVYDNYKGYRIHDVMECLRNPPSTEGKQWRLTPDTINEWMEVQIGKIQTTEKQPKTSEPPEPPELSENPDTHQPPIDVDKMLNEHLANLRESKVKGVPTLTKKEIREEGQSEPPHPKGMATAQFLTTKEEADLKENRLQWMRECYDLITGKPNDNYLPFEQWTKKYAVF